MHWVHTGFESPNVGTGATISLGDVCPSVGKGKRKDCVSKCKFSEFMDTYYVNKGLAGAAGFVLILCVRNRNS